MTLPAVHPAADIWPLMTDEELDDLAADIVQHGQRLPIPFVDGLLLDGRNRWLACERANIEPWTADVETDDPDALAWSLNEHRRHAPVEVRAIAAGKRQTLARGDNQHSSGELPSQTDVADRFGISVATLKRARTVVEHGNPVIIDAVTSGDVAVSLAEKTVRRIEETGEAITSVADIKRVMRETWREDNPAPPAEPRRREPERSHVPVDTFGVINALVRHAARHPAAEAARQIDKWTRLNILDDLPLALAYLTELQAALAEKGE